MQERGFSHTRIAKCEKFNEIIVIVGHLLLLAMHLAGLCGLHRADSRQLNNGHQPSC